MILEDNPYGDLRFAGAPVPAIKSFDEDGIVMYAGTFSKVISPGMRVGYAIGPKPVLQKMIVCKQGEDVHTNILSQMICHAFMTQYDYDAHLAGLRIVPEKIRADGGRDAEKSRAGDYLDAGRGRAVCLVRCRRASICFRIARRPSEKGLRGTRQRFPDKMKATRAMLSGSTSLPRRTNSLSAGLKLWAAPSAI